MSDTAPPKGLVAWTVVPELSLALPQRGLSAPLLKQPKDASAFSLCGPRKYFLGSSTKGGYLPKILI